MQKENEHREDEKVIGKQWAKVNKREGREVCGNKMEKEMERERKREKNGYNENLWEVQGAGGWADRQTDRGRGVSVCTLSLSGYTGQGSGQALSSPPLTQIIWPPFSLCGAGREGLKRVRTLATLGRFQDTHITHTHMHTRTYTHTCSNVHAHSYKQARTTNFKHTRTHRCISNTNNT